MWRPKTSQSVNCAKEEPNIAAFSKTSICKFGWEPELDLDENLDGWVSGKQVGCYFAFYRKLSWKQNYASLIPSDNDQEKEDEADVVHNKVELWRENVVSDPDLSSFSLHELKICPDTQCALRIRCRAKVGLDSIRFDTSVKRRLNWT